MLSRGSTEISLSRLPTSNSLLPWPAVSLSAMQPDFDHPLESLGNHCSCPFAEFRCLANEIGFI